MSERGRVIEVFVILTVIWGTTWAAIRVALEGIPPLAGVSLRFTIAGAVLLLWARWRGIRVGSGAAERRLWVVNALLSFVGSYGLIYWAEQRVPSGLASVLFATFPLWVTLLGRRLLPDERSSSGQLLGVALGFVGTAILFSEDLDRELGPGALMAAIALVVAPLLSATASVTTKRWGRGLAPESLSAMSMLLGGLVLAPISALTEQGRSWSNAPGPWLATIYLAVVGSAVTFPLYFWLLARRSAVSAALISYTAPVIAVVLGVILFDERLTLRLGAGAVCVLTGVAWALRPRQRHSLGVHSRPDG
jgi:drug/metabolite transporter (DMT)-like permease